MKVLLYRRGLDLDSGAGQLIWMQARGLKAAGVKVRLACERGALEFFLRTGLSVRYSSPTAAARQRAPADLIVDHGMEIPRADLVFVHNLVTEANLHLRRPDLAQQVAAEAAFFASLRIAVPIVVNSELVKAALLRHFALGHERVVVHYPGIQIARFNPQRALSLRRRARYALRLDDRTPLIGFVTSGDFQKRGLDLFLASAQRIGAALPSARFLVVGSKRLPDWATDHPAIAGGKVLYRRKNRSPDLWMSALDVFLYAARFEEFGMVILEALALGVPVLTSRRVGAAECLPESYAPWLTAEPEPEELAANALRLLADDDARRALTAAGTACASTFDQQRYALATVAEILAQKR